jgi:membrane-bound lytic murein transglycosylase F
MISRFSLLKSKKSHILIRCFVFILCGLFIFFIFKQTNKKNSYTPPFSWNEIKNKGNLRVGILYNYTDYYVSHGAVYGFHYEMINEMASQLGLKVIYKVYHSYPEYYMALLNNQIDIIAMDVLQNRKIEPLFDYTIPHSYSSIVLVQNKDKKCFNINDSSFASDKITYSINIPLTRHYNHALHLKKTFPLALTIKESNLLSEDIIQAINEGTADLSIDYEKNIRANSIFYKHIDYSVVLTKPLPLHWISRKRNDSLIIYINDWMNTFIQTHLYKLLLQKYYNPYSPTRALLQYKSRYSTLGNISPYDEIIEKYANKYELDWLLVSSLIYQESKFQAYSNGGGGAYGLMQFMPTTADDWDVNIGDSPEKQIKAGCKYLKFLQNKYYQLGIKDTNELMKFMLAAYNAGTCRVDDARTLAKFHGLNESIWDKNVEEALIMLSQRKHIKKAQLKCGRFTQADHTIQYVDDIVYRYYHYKNLFNQNINNAQ